jgi:hypothetical protein
LYDQSREISMPAHHNNANPMTGFLTTLLPITTVRF